MKKPPLLLLLIASLFFFCLPAQPRNKEEVVVAKREPVALSPFADTFEAASADWSPSFQPHYRWRWLPPKATIFQRFNLRRREPGAGMEDEPMLVDFVDSMCRWGDASYDRYTIFGDVRLKFRTKRLTVRIKFKTP